MFDPVGAFEKQFTPVDGGYLYYPSRKTGGKLVTIEEYQRLTADWARVSGSRGIWKLVASIFGALIIWEVISQAVSLPKQADKIAIIAIVAVVFAFLLWASLAPRRLVKGRAFVSAPRRLGEAQRQARTALNWSFVLFALVLSGGVFSKSLGHERTLLDWVWLIGSGGMFALYGWIAVQKMLDRKR